MSRAIETGSIQIRPTTGYYGTYQLFEVHIKLHETWCYHKSFWLDGNIEDFKVDIDDIPEYNGSYSYFKNINGLTRLVKF